MGITVLASYLTMSYQNRVNSLQHNFRQSKKLLKEKHALNLAHFAFNKLKNIATNDFIATCEKDGKLHFYNIQTESSQDLGPIELYSNKDRSGVIILANEELNTSIGCLFQKDGLRKTLSSGCFSEIPHTNKEKIKQRWDNLQTDGYLKAPLFLPLMSELQVKDNTINLKLYNPFDRKLQGTINIEIQGFENQVRTDRFMTTSLSVATIKTEMQQISIDIAPKGISSTTVNLSENFTNLEEIRLEGLIYKHLTDGQHKLTYSKPNEPFSYTFLLTSPSFSGSRSVGKWGRKKSAPSSTPTKPTISISHELPSFETQNWLQQLNACCFFGEKWKPYRTVDNFEVEESDSITLRDFFWNCTVTDPKTTVFNFNGSEQHLRKQFETIGFFSSAAEQQETITNILSHQPYPNAVVFLKEVKRFQDQLYLFKNLAHRIECFTIQSYCENVKCKMTVFRKAKDFNVRTWEIQNIELITDAPH